MSDAGFNLTPHDIRAQEFAPAFRGVDRASVLAFKEKVAEEFERLLRERAQSEERLRNFQEQLRAFGLAGLGRDPVDRLCDLRTDPPASVPHRPDHPHARRHTPG